MVELTVHISDSLNGLCFQSRLVASAVLTVHWQPPPLGLRRVCRSGEQFVLRISRGPFDGFRWLQSKAGHRSDSRYLDDLQLAYQSGCARVIAHWQPEHQPLALRIGRAKRVSFSDRYSARNSFGGPQSTTCAIGD